MKKMLILAMTMAMVLLAAAGVCETLRVGMECNYAPYNWTQSDASENAVAIAAGGYADGYDVRIAKIIADQLGMELENRQDRVGRPDPGAALRQHRRDYRGHEPDRRAPDDH